MMETKIQKRTIKEMSFETKKILDILIDEDNKIGDIITYDFISKAIGRDVREYASGSLYSAKRIAKNKHGAVWETVRGIGFKLLNDSEIVESCDFYEKKIKKQAREGRKTLEKIRDFEKLPEEKKTEALYKNTMFGTLEQAMSHSAKNRLREAVQNEQRQLPFGISMEQLRGTKK